MTPATGNDVRRLAEEQAALRRVATLVAGAADPQLVFEAVTAEASELLDLPILTLMRLEADGTATVLAATSARTFPVGANLTLDGPSALLEMIQTGGFARIDSYAGMPGTIAERLRSAGARAGYAAPIVVDGRLWGAMTAVQTAPGVFVDVERRLASFIDLIALAISNAQARDELGRLAREQASLRRVATLVARDSMDAGLFSTVAQEVQQLFAVPDVAIVRYEERAVVLVGTAGGNPFIPLGDRYVLDGPSVCAQVLATGRPARFNGYGGLPGAVAETARSAGFRSVAGAPIAVAGRVWGAIIVVSSRDPLPESSDARLAEYTELVATAISNATTRAELIASRARIVAAGDEAQRRIERNLHDGIQQRLIAIALDVQTVRGRLPEAGPPVRDGLERLERDLESVLEEVREISRGLHPPLLARRGLRPPLLALARRSPIPVELQISGPRAPEPVEIAAYYAVSEALTNAIKHSRASVVTVELQTTPTLLRAVVGDDGVGGAVVAGGTGLRGLIDRVDALGGTLTIHSPAGAGTRLEMRLPISG
jgi:signal transduction histidine kinase